MIKDILEQLAPLDAQIAALKGSGSDMEAITAHASELAELAVEEDEILRSCGPLTAEDRVFLARHPERPHIDETISALFTDFFEQRGDRQCKEDAAILGGVARFHGMPVTVIGHRKGSTLEENLACNFGMPGPEGYRKALRLMKQAEKFGRPIITFIDTPGAYPGKDAEERGQGEAIARNLMEMSGLTVPVIAVVTGEGSSGGALALGVANHIANMAAAQVAIHFGLKGMCTCPVTACAGGTNAVGDAFHRIRDGYETAMVCGGAESCISPLGIGGFTSMKALSTATDPDAASLPFDARRGGFVMGEGSGVLVLEELEHARARGAHIYAEVVGYGANCDAYHFTAPAPGGTGAIDCMKLTLADAGIAPEQVDHINAHGTGTHMNDACETATIHAVFGEHAKQLTVVSTKSMTGHLLGGAGGIEAVFTALALRDQFAPPTIHYEQPDPECDLDYVPNAGRAQAMTYAAQMLDGRLLPVFPGGRLAPRPGASCGADRGRRLPGASGLYGLRAGIFTRRPSSLLFRRLQGRRKPPEKPGTH